MAYLSDQPRRRSRPSDEVIDRIAQLCGVTADWLMCADGLDRELVREAIEEVEEFTIRARRRMAPNLKAARILSVYDEVAAQLGAGSEEMTPEKRRELVRATVLRLSEQ